MRTQNETQYDPYAFLNEDPEKAKKVKDIVMSVIVLVGMVGTYAAGQISKPIMAVVIGVMFLLVGITLFVYNRKIKAYPEQWLRPIAAVMIGVAMTVLPLFSMGEKSEAHSFIIVLAFAVFSLLLGGFIIFSPFFEAAMKKRRCTNTVRASCVAVEFRSGGRSPRYEHIWEYPYGNIKVTVPDGIVSSHEKPYVGSIEELAVNPDDPNDVYRRVPSRTFFMILTGSLVMFIGAVLFVILGMMLAH